MAIGISLASYLPWSAVFATRTAKWAREAGYDFLQVVPFRSSGHYYFHKEQAIHGVSETWKSTLERGLSVLYVEEAWNPAYTHRGKEPLTPIKLEDRLFFPSRWQCVGIVDFFRKWGATLIVHHMEDSRNENSLLEVHPGLWKTAEEIRDTVADQRLVLDLYHLRRYPEPYELAHKPPEIEDNRSLLGSWREAMVQLLPKTKVIHVSPSREKGSDEFLKFFARIETQLESMINFAKELGFEGDWVVEATLGKEGLQWWKLKRVMKRFRERLVEILEA